MDVSRVAVRVRRLSLALTHGRAVGHGCVSSSYTSVCSVGILVLWSLKNGFYATFVFSVLAYSETETRAPHCDDCHSIAVTDTPASHTANAAQASAHRNSRRRRRRLRALRLGLSVSVRQLGDERCAAARDLERSASARVESERMSTTL